ncbi:hypothetical protein ACWD2L_00490 [Streptomyces sp. NPDC002754]
MMLNLGSGDDSSCAQVMQCVGSNLGGGLTFDDGSREIYVDISSDTGNLTEYGSDGGVYTPPSVVTAGTATTVTGHGTPEDPYVINTAPEVGDTALEAGPGVTISGSGVTSDPYVISSQGEGASYGVAQNMSVVEMTVMGRIAIPLGLKATTNVLANGDVTDNGNGTLTINRPGYYVIAVTPRFQASARAYGAVYAYIENAAGAAQSWGGMSVPVSPDGRTAYSLGYAINATVNVTSPTVVKLSVSKSTYIVTARLNWAEFVIQRMGPAYGGASGMDGDAPPADDGLVPAPAPVPSPETDF